MLYSKVHIEAMAHVHPQGVLTSEEVEERLADYMRAIRVPPGRLAQVTGIRQRRVWPNGTPPSKGGIQAAELALHRSGVDPEDIGCLVYTSVCRDHLEPATSTIIHDALGLPKCSTCFDVSNACLGFLNGLAVIGNMIELGQIRAGLVVASENSGPVVASTLERMVADPSPSRRTFKKMFPTLTLGSGSVAAVLTHESITRAGHRLLGGAHWSATEYNEACRCTPDMGFADECHPIMVTDAITVMDRGCELARRCWQACKERLGWENDTPERVFCHQIGLSHRDALFGALELPTAKDFSIVQRFGNMGSVGLPMTLSMGVEAGAVEAGMRVALLGIGSGLNSIMLGLEW